ncbi:MAG: hypothetical protein NC034_05445 [Ruminococcus sp.]|nr:hypothetical protein [Ruminococcus sp.]
MEHSVLPPFAAAVDLAVPAVGFFSAASVEDELVRSAAVGEDAANYVPVKPDAVEGVLFAVDAVPARAVAYTDSVPADIDHVGTAVCTGLDLADIAPVGTAVCRDLALADTAPVGTAVCTGLAPADTAPVGTAVCTGLAPADIVPVGTAVCTGLVPADIVPVGTAVCTGLVPADMTAFADFAHEDAAFEDSDYEKAFSYQAVG